MGELGDVDLDPRLLLKIDAGTSTNAPVVDFDNNPRPLGAGVDIGAYEFAPLSVAPPTARNRAARTRARISPSATTSTG